MTHLIWSVGLRSKFEGKGVPVDRLQECRRKSLVGLDRRSNATATWLFMLESHLLVLLVVLLVLLLLPAFLAS